VASAFSPVADKLPSLFGAQPKAAPAAANAAAVAPPRKKLRRLTVVLFFDDIDPPPVRMLIFRQSVSKQVISSLLWMFRAANEHSSCSRFGAVDV
jgi:hypothetical protein